MGRFSFSVFGLALLEDEGRRPSAADWRLSRAAAAAVPHAPKRRRATAANKAFFKRHVTIVTKSTRAQKEMWAGRAFL